MTTLLETHEHWGGWWFFAPLLWIAMFILLISLLRGLFWRRHQHHWHGHQARSLLAERYAKGEIDVDDGSKGHSDSRASEADGNVSNSPDHRYDYQHNSPRCCLGHSFCDAIRQRSNWPSKNSPQVIR